MSLKKILFYAVIAGACLIAIAVHEIQIVDLKAAAIVNSLAE